MSSWTRELFNEFEILFKQVYGVKGVSKMDPHEFVAKLYLQLKGTSGLLGQFALNKLFQLGEGKEFSEVYCLKAKERTITALGHLNSMNRELKQGLSKKDLLISSLVVQKIIENDLEIIDYGNFLTNIQILDSKISLKSREQHGKDSEKEETQKPDAAYYHEWVRLNWGDYREKRQRKLWALIKKDYSFFSIKEVKMVA
jgi:hypothetical protein